MALLLFVLQSGMEVLLHCALDATTLLPDVMVLALFYYGHSLCDTEQHEMVVPKSSLVAALTSRYAAKGICM
jgi:hypothetical protein